MKRVSRPTVFIFFIVLAFCTAYLFAQATVYPLQTVNAIETIEYLRVIDEDTPFYADKTSDNPLFYLPYTYYVRVLERGDFYTHVEYAVKGYSMDGYVPTNKLFYDGLTVTEPFPSVTVTTAGTTVLYKDDALSSSLQYIFEGRAMYYYGKYFSPQGKTLYYVGYNNRLGYVKEEDLMPFTINYHPNELTFLKSEEPEPDTSATDNGTKTAEQPAENDAVFNLRIAIIVVLGLAGFIALAVALGKKPKTSPAASYYDENDYE